MVADRPSAGSDATMASRYARALLDDLGSAAPVIGRADHPAWAWRRAGLSMITGAANGPGLVCPAPLASAADGAILALEALTDGAGRLPANGAVLLGERARLLHLSRRGPVSPNGSCRLLTCSDGTIALNLARDEDWMLLPALFEAPVAPEWDAVADMAGRASAATLVARGVELGLAVALDQPPTPSAGWFTLAVAGASSNRDRPPPRVIDLSSLWAGPLAGSLLAMLGAEVIKVESTHRVDGARDGNPEFFTLLNGIKQHVALDFRDRATLAALIATADIVIEGSRPRALRRLGIDAAAFVAQGGIWLSITGHGRHGIAGERIGFGDDAAVAAGLSATMRAGWSEAFIAGDAIADPLTGIHAALVGWALWRLRRRALVSLSLAGVVRHALALGAVANDALAYWQRVAESDDAPLYPMRTPC